MLQRARGRPRLPPERKRKFRVQVAVNLVELRAARKAANEAEMTVSEWARALIAEALKRPVR